MVKPRLPYGFLIAAALVLALERLVLADPQVVEALWAKTLPGGDDNIIRAQMAARIAARSRLPERILVLGASDAREGVDNVRLYRRFSKQGWDVYNLGIAGMQPMDLYQFQSDAWASRPKLLILFVSPYFFFKEYEDRKIAIYFHPRMLPRVLAGMGWKYVWERREAYADGLAGSVSAVHRYRWFLKRLIEGGDFTRLLDPVLSRPKAHLYWTGLTQEERRRAAKLYAGATYYKRYPETPFQRRLFEEILASWAKRPARVILIESPLSPTLKPLYRQEFLDEFKAAARGAAEAKGIRYVRVEELPVFGEKDFLDFTHFSSEGRAKMTAFLEQMIDREIRLLSDPLVST